MPSPRRPRVRYPNKMGVRIVCEARSHEPRVVQLGRINKLPPDAHPSSALGTVATTGGWGNSRGTREELIGDTPVERTGLAADHSNAADVLAESERITQHGRQRITFRCGFCGDCVQLSHEVLYGVAYCLHDTPLDELTLDGLRSVMLVAAKTKSGG